MRRDPAKWHSFQCRVLCTTYIQCALPQAMIGWCQSITMGLKWLSVQEQHRELYRSFKIHITGMYVQVLFACACTLQILAPYLG